MHWPSTLQPDPPAGILATQAPTALQYWVVGQGAFTPHAPAHIVVLAHRLLVQLVLVPGLQTPVPSHFGAGAAVPPLQLGDPQSLPVI